VHELLVVQEKTGGCLKSLNVEQDMEGSKTIMSKTEYDSNKALRNESSSSTGRQWVVRQGEDFPQVRPLNGIMRKAGADAFIAGGCFKHLFEGRKPRDIDMYFTSREAFERARQAFLDDGYEIAYQTGNATGIRSDGHLPIDLVTRYYRTAEDTIGMFDFSITKCAYRFDPEHPDQFQLVYSPSYFEDLTCKRLVIDGELPLPINTFQRLEKYTRYGYTLCRGSKIRLLAAIRGWQPKHPTDNSDDDLENALSHSLYESMD
jgi:hypothetical protein